MNKKITGVLAVAIVIIAVGGYFFPQVKPFFGSSAGPEYTETQYFFGGAVDGSGCFATSTSGTLTAKDLKDNSCIHITSTSSQAVLSLTLPATSTMSNLLPKVGSCRQWFIDANDVAAATTTTIVAGAGHNLVGLDATGAGTGADVIDGAEFGTLKMCRQSNSDVVTFVQEYIHAD